VIFSRFLKRFSGKLKGNKMPSLQARTSMQRFHPLFFLSKLLSFSMLGFLLFAGWVGVCYVKKERDNRHNVVKPMQISSSSPSSTNLSLTKVNTVASDETAQQKIDTKLVYFCSSDKEYYHTAKHLSSHCARIALSETAAMERGLKRCLNCFSE
jgi:hypothetical protein